MGSLLKKIRGGNSRVSGSAPLTGLNPAKKKTMYAPKASPVASANRPGDKKRSTLGVN